MAILGAFIVIFLIPGFLTPLEGTARYMVLLLAPAEGFGQGFVLPYCKPFMASVFTLEGGITTNKRKPIKLFTTFFYVIFLRDM